MANERVHTAPISEYYQDLLTLDSWIEGRTKGTRAASLLCEKLQEQEEKINQRLEHLAVKRGIDVKELRTLILQGKAGNNSDKE